ncbi:MAG TPA: serine hydrolase [Candidatus Peribacteraceae bacterium]|nr:serine hydrolase [Candidatus Peribacteraceae bacterium]
MFSAFLPIFLLGLWPAPQTARAETAVIASLPVPPPVEPLLIPEHLSASGVLVVDATSGQPLYATQSTYRRPIASLTKLMTALLIVENHSLDEIVTIPEAVNGINGTQIQLQPGDQFTVGEMLSAILIPSANDAAIALAHHHSGSVDEFVKAMNERADKLGLRNTRFDDPVGMDSPDQYSTPKDIVWLFRYVLDEPEIASRLGQAGARITSNNGVDITLSHTHDMLHGANTPIVAGKTGTSPAAGECLISLVQSGGRDYVVVFLNSSSRYEDMRAVLRALHIPS